MAVLVRSGVQNLLSVLVLVVTLAPLVALALHHPGEAVRRLPLNDSGVWVTNDQDGLFGRINTSARTQDARLGPPGTAQSSYSLDVDQDQSTVVGYDRLEGELFGVDVRTGRSVAGLAVHHLSADTQVEMRAGSIATLDPASGQVHAVRYQADDPAPDLAALDPDQPGLASLGAQPERQAALAVGADGVVHAVARSGRELTLTPSATGFQAPRYDQLAPFRSVQLTAVGATPVVLDAASRTVTVGSSPARPVSEVRNSSVLQQPGDPAGDVVLATKKVLLAVPLAPGPSRTLASGGTGLPARPVRLGTCSYGAWAGESAPLSRVCDGSPPTTYVVDREGTLSQPVFRVNRGHLLLNDTADGLAYDPALQRRVDAWHKIEPPTSTTGTHTQPSKKRKPDAKDDLNLGARMGRVNVLHVLDNDRDPAGRILTISTDAPRDLVEVAPDRQTLLYHPTGDDPQTSFSYTVSNGLATDTARVKVHLAGRNENRPPFVADIPEPSWSVVSDGSLTMPVLDRWRDPESDPLTLPDVSSDAGTATVVDNQLEVAAPHRGRRLQLEYEVSDAPGTAEPQHARRKTSVTVLAPDASRGTPPTARPDYAAGITGVPLVVRPLANDLPGADPVDPDAALTLVSQVDGTSDLRVATDRKNGEVTVTAARAGSYALRYTLGYGSQKQVQGAIRVDVRDPGSSQKPVAVVDAVTLHGAEPGVVDVLANDADPGGGVLTVQSATADEGSGLDVAVVHDRWLRITSAAGDAEPAQQVHYVVSNGPSTATGEVDVTLAPEVPDDTPVTQDDHAVVRAGDAVVIPVLQNDSTPGDTPLTLLTQVGGASAGELPVTDAADRTQTSPAQLGRAYVSTKGVRYVAPVDVPEPRTVQITYTAQSGSQVKAGTATVDITPPHSATQPDEAPAPQTIEAHAVTGQTITIPVPATGSDPDGDSTGLVGIASAPTLGRVLHLSPTGITYQAYPEGEGGTDSFDYRVSDQYGRTGQATIRVGVVPPGDAQPPVAVPDEVTAEPGAQVTVFLKANDLYDPAAPVRVEAADLPPAVKDVDAESGTAKVVVPEDPDAPPVHFSYRLVGDGDRGPSADVTVRSQQGYDNPPVVSDQVAKAKGGAATVDVLAGAWDPDDDAKSLTATLLDPPAGASVSGGTVTLPQQDHLQYVPYQVSDRRGGVATAQIYVPARGAGDPIANGRTVQLDPGKPTQVQLQDYVVSPRNRPLSLTGDRRPAASPAEDLDVSGRTGRAVTVTADKDYAGPGDVSVEVTDASSATDPDARTALVSIPVQVGPATPVLRCPDGEIRLYAGGRAVEQAISTLCQVWTPDPAAAAGLDYAWATPAPDGFTLSGDGTGTLSVQAGVTAPVGKSVTLEVTVPHTSVKPGRLTFVVDHLPPPTLRSVSRDEVKAGTSVTVDLAGSITSPLQDPQPRVLSAEPESGATTVSHSGSTVTVTPQHSGTSVVDVAVTDSADESRRATGTITVTAFDKPGTPTDVRADAKGQSHTATVSWRAGSAHGTPITGYSVRWSGGQQSCPASPCAITGLENAKPVSFRVTATNKAGDSPPSAASNSVTPDAVPGAPGAPVVSDLGPKSLTLTWAAAKVDGTPVRSYTVTWGAHNQKVSGSTTTLRVTGLDDDVAYDFTVIATNGAGNGPASHGSGQSSGLPGVPEPSESDNADGSTDQATVTLTWPAVSLHGPSSGDVSYQVARRGGQGKTATVTGTSWTDSGLDYDGTSYSYTVTAVKTTGALVQRSGPSSSVPFVAVRSKPDAWGGWSAKATGDEGQVELSYDVPASRGDASKVTLLDSAGSSQDGLPAGKATSTTSRTDTVSLSNGVEHTLALQLCNENGCLTSGHTETVTPYGPLTSGSIDGSANGPIVSYTVNGDGNGRPADIYVNGNKVDTWSGQGSYSHDEPVGYNKSFTVTAQAKDPQRKDVTWQKTFTTASPPARNVDVTRSGNTVRVHGTNYQAGTAVTIKYWKTTCRVVLDPSKHVECDGDPQTVATVSLTVPDAGFGLGDFNNSRSIAVTRPDQDIGATVSPS